MLTMVEDGSGEINDSRHKIRNWPVVQAHNRE
jgi:hypothetical protein